MSQAGDDNASAVASPRLQYPPAAAAGIGLAVLAVWTLVVFGNLLVIAAIARDRKVSSLQNWFLASLAFADLLLGVLVMPFSLANQLLGAWVFGHRWCELWLVIDVLACTASIMNLCLISLDRYWSVSRALTYPRLRTPKRAAAMIGVVWLLSAVICLPPLLGWRKPQARPDKCELTNDIGYVLYSSIGSFYLPMLIMLVVYARIFRVARARARRRCPGGGAAGGTSRNVAALDRSARCLQLRADKAEKAAAAAVSMRLAKVEAEAEAEVEVETEAEVAAEASMRLVESSTNFTSPASGAPAMSAAEAALQHKRRLARARERRATLVLGLIMGAFVLCWFPFFTTYLADIFCRCVPLILFDFFFWLGYCNSALNPVIYTVFNKDFRQAFRQILTCDRR